MSEADTRTDEQLVAAHATGEPGAIEALIRRYRPELVPFLIRMLGKRDAAEDVFQETFLQIHLSVDAFDTSRRFKPWLFTIAANKARDYFRKHGKHAAMADLSAPVRGGGGGSSATAFVDLLQSDSGDLDAGLTADELRDRVRGVMEEMPHHLREILLLAYFQRLSYAQIAESLKIPLGTVKSRLHAAVGTFADRWRQNGTIETDQTSP